jgi:hypothetical protein
MKKTLSLIVSLIWLAQTTYSQNSFYMEYQMSFGAGKETMNTTNKIWQSYLGSRMENEMNIPGLGLKKTVMLMLNSHPDVIISLNEEGKSYTEILKQQSADDKNLDFTIEIIGNEKIGIYNCTHAKIKSKDNVMDVWMTKDIEGYKDFKNNSWISNQAKGMEKAFKSPELEGIVVRFKDTSRKEGITMELIKFEKGNYPATMFQIPAGYVKGMSFDPSKMQNMNDEERQKMIEQMMKEYGNQEKK